MVKKKALNVIVNSEFCDTAVYNVVSGNIKLPNLKGLSFYYGCEQLKLLIQSLTHEFMHKWLHENISYVAMLMWDNIDKKRLNEIEVYVYSAY